MQQKTTNRRMKKPLSQMSWNRLCGPTDIAPSIGDEATRSEQATGGR